MRFLNFRYRSLGIIFTCLLLQGCYLIQSASKPMPAQRFEAAAPAAGLIVLLPGFGDGPQSVGYDRLKRDPFRPAGVAESCRMAISGFRL